MTRVHVIAQNREHFVHWCREIGISPLDRRVIFVARARDLLGYRDVSVIYYGPYHQRRDLKEIDEQLAMLRAIGQLREPVHQETPRRPSFFH